MAIPTFENDQNDLHLLQIIFEVKMKTQRLMGYTKDAESNRFESSEYCSFEMKNGKKADIRMTF